MTSHPPIRRGPKPNPNLRSELVQMGLRVMHSGGYTATGVQSLVEGVGIPKGTFYRHFPSKEAFAGEVLNAYFERNKAALQALIDNAEIAPLTRLEMFFDKLIDAFRSIGFARGCLLGNFTAETADHSESIREHLSEQFNAWSAFFDRCISEAQKQGYIGKQYSSSLLGRFLLNSWEGALLRMRVEKTDAALIEFKEIIFKKLLL